MDTPNHIQSHHERFIDAGAVGERRGSVRRTLLGHSAEEGVEGRLIERLGLKNQYEKCINSLKRFGFLNENGKVKNGLAEVPSMETALSALPKEKLELAKNFQKPTLLLVPIVSFRNKVEALDSYKQFDVKLNSTHVDDFYNGMGTGTITKVIGWKVSIVDGAQEMKEYQGDDSDLDIADRIEAVRSARKSGEEAIDYDEYIMLMMQSIADGQPIDRDTYTVFDGDGFKDKITYARFFKKLNRVGFEWKDPSFITGNARFRSVVRGEDVRP